MALPELDSIPNEIVEEACEAAAIHRHELEQAWQYLRAHGITGEGV